jgi:hypothetical protein
LTLSVPGNVVKNGSTQGNDAVTLLRMSQEQAKSIYTDLHDYFATHDADEVPDNTVSMEELRHHPSTANTEAVEAEKKTG